MSRRPATARPSRSPQAHQTLRREMLETILALPVPAFDQLVARLLQSCGYEGVQVLGEARGGADLIASAPGALCSALTLVQAKQYVAPVSRRFVDELRGAMLRLGAPHGLLLTTSTFYDPALQAANKECPLPICLVDGDDLLDLLLSHRLGVRLCPNGRLALDAEFFTRLTGEHSFGQIAPARAPGFQPCAFCGQPGTREGCPDPCHLDRRAR